MKYDVILWDNIGSPYSRSLVDAKAIGGSEYALVLLAEAFARKGLKVVGASNASRDHIASQNNVEYIAASRFDDFDPAINPVSTSVLIVSRFSSLPKNITYDRVFVLAQDQPWIDADGKCVYDIHDIEGVMRPDGHGTGTLVCMSEWHANLFRKNYPAWNIIVIPAAIDDVHYLMAAGLPGKDPSRPHFSPPPRNPNKFVYASAAVKGLDATLAEWRRLKMDHLDLLKNAELHVTTPGYDHPSSVFPAHGLNQDVILHDPIPARELSTFMADAAGLFFCNTYPESFCLHPDTEISVPGDHRGGPPTVRIKDLVGKSGFPVYALDIKKNRFEIRTCKRVWQSAHVKTMLAIELDNGKTLRITHKHKVLNYDREWVAADSLQVGDRLTALHYRYNVSIQDANGRWVDEHRLVGHWKNGRRLVTEQHVDHSDPMRLDNRPEALTVMSRSAHMSKTHTGRPMRKSRAIAFGKRISKWAKENPEVLSAKSSNQLKDRWRRIKKKMTPEEIAAYMKPRTDAMLAARMKKSKAWHLARAHKGAKKRAATIAAKRAVRERAKAENHKIVKITEIAGGPVYDMEVEGLHNFVAEQIVVHNCVVAAIAEIMGCRTHILVEPPGELDVFRSTLNSVMPTRDRRQFEEMFVHIFSGGLDYMPPAPKDFRMSTLIEAWMDAAFPVTPGFRRYIPDAETSAILEAGPTMIVGTAVSPDVYTKVPDEHFEALMGFNPSSPDDEKYTMSIRWSVDCGATTKTIESASYPGPYQKRKPYASPTLTKLEGEALVIGEGSDYPMLENRGLGPDRKATPMKLYNPPTLGLVIIAKNERDVLPRALLSSKGIVDFYTVVLDQQNNDDSIEVIDATDGLPDGPVHRAPSAFSGHAAARNEALRLASVRHATDFLLMLDADDSLSGTCPILDPQYDGYEVMIIDGTLKYRRLAITRPGVVTYKRRAHEYPETKAGAKIGFLPELVIIRGSGGDARKTPFKKFLKDIEWLEKDLREMPNDPRTVFYLAQSHWDAARACEDPVLQKTHYKRARALYVQRALQENTFGQERFISRMRAATLSELFGEKFYAKAHWLAALEEDPRRWPEPAVELVRMYNGDQKFAMALAIGMPNRLVDGKLDRKGIVFEPPDDGLFVDVEPYQWKLKLELSVTVFYLGNKRQSAFWTQELIDAPTTPEYVKTTLRSNLEFCK